MMTYPTFSSDDSVLARPSSQLSIEEWADRNGFFIVEFDTLDFRNIKYSGEDKFEYVLDGFAEETKFIYHSIHAVKEANPDAVHFYSYSTGELGHFALTKDFDTWTWMSEDLLPIWQRAIYKLEFGKYPTRPPSKGDDQKVFMFPSSDRTSTQ